MLMKESYVLLLIECRYWWLLRCGLQEFLVCFILLKFGIISTIVFVVLVIFLLIGTIAIISSDVIWIEIIPLVDRHHDEISIAFIWNVNGNERVSELLWIQRNDLWISVLRWMILRRLIVGIENVDCILTRSRWCWQLVTVTRAKKRHKLKTQKFTISIKILCSVTYT